MEQSIKKRSGFQTRQLTIIAVVAAMSAILMRFEMALPFLPPFYKIDMSEVAVLISGFAYGPVVAIFVEIFKNVIYVLFGGTSSAFVGEFANIITGIAFVLPPVIWYQRHKTKKQATLGLLFGVLTLTIVGALMNYYILLPLYAGIYQMPLEQMIAIGTQLNGSVNNLWTFVLFMSVPFNLIKGILVACITLLTYKKIASLLKGFKK